VYLCVRTHPSVCGYICVHACNTHTHAGRCMFVCLGERERHGVRKAQRQTQTHTHPTSVYIPLFDLGTHRRQNKNHTPAASRQSEIYLHSLLSPGRWMGPIWSPLQDPLWEWRRRRDATQTCTNLKTERFGRCYLWNPGGTPEGERGKEPHRRSAGSGGLGAFGRGRQGTAGYLRCLRCWGSCKVFCWHRALGRALRTKGRDKK